MSCDRCVTEVRMLHQIKHGLEMRRRIWRSAKALGASSGAKCILLPPYMNEMNEKKRSDIVRDRSLRSQRCNFYVRSLPGCGEIRQTAERSYGCFNHRPSSSYECITRDLEMNFRMLGGPGVSVRGLCPLPGGGALIHVRAAPGS